MSLEHLPSAILTATLLLRLARLVRYRDLRTLIRTGLLTAAVAAGALPAGRVRPRPQRRPHPGSPPAVIARNHERKSDMTIASAPTFLAATDLVSGSHSLYTIGVGVLVVLILLGGGARAAGSFFGGRIGATVAWALTAVIVAVVVGSGYAIYASTKRTVDRTGITTGQFGQ